MLLHVGLDSWIVQDGNYPDFRTGKDYRFAVEFGGELNKATGAPSGPSLRHLGRDQYEACGEVIFRSDSVWALDFGVPAFWQSPPPDWVEVGSLASGEISFGVDPFFYLENLKDLRGMPDLFRQWHLRTIELETTPWLETAQPGGGVHMHRDQSRESFAEVAKTDAWNDDDGHASYLFACELLETAG